MLCQRIGLNLCRPFKTSYRWRSRDLSESGHSCRLVQCLSVSETLFFSAEEQVDLEVDHVSKKEARQKLAFGASSEAYLVIHRPYITSTFLEPESRKGLTKNRRRSEPPRRLSGVPDPWD